MIGYAFCGSFCTFEQSFASLSLLKAKYGEIMPIMSDNAYSTDTRFGKSEEWIDRIEGICGRKIIHSVKEAEPLGPKISLDALIIAPCTGNTLAKLAHGIADGPVTMAAKSHLRNGRPVVVAVSTNDALSGAAENIGKLLNRKNIYFVPFGQDDPAKKPTSIVADFTKLPEALSLALEGKQIQPLLV